MIKGLIILLQENSPNLLGVELKSPSGQDRYPHSENERLLGICVRRTPGCIMCCSFLTSVLQASHEPASSVISYFSEAEAIGSGTK